MISKCLKLGLLLVGGLALSVVPAHAVPYSATNFDTLTTLGVPLAFVPTLHSCYDRDSTGTLSFSNPTCSAPAAGNARQGEVFSSVNFDVATGIYTYVYKVTPLQQAELLGADTRFRGVHLATSVPRPLGQLEDSADTNTVDPPLLNDYSTLHVDDAIAPLVPLGAGLGEGPTGLGYSFSQVTGFGSDPLCTNLANNCPSLRGQTDLTGQNVLFLGWTDPVTPNPLPFGNLAPAHWDLGKEGATNVKWWNAGEQVTLFWQTIFDDPVLGGLSFDFTGGGNPNGTVQVYVPGPANVVPEPGTLVLMATGLGLVGLAGLRARRKKVV